MSMYGPPSMSTQYGTAFHISSIVSLIALGLPGKLNIKHLWVWKGWMNDDDKLVLLSKSPVGASGSQKSATLPPL